MSNIELKDGEVVCPKCNGNTLNNDPYYDSKDYETWYCDKCNGTGKLDWVENIVGKKPDPYESLTIPLVRKMYPKLLTKDLVNAQSMTDVTFFKDILK